MLMVAYIGFKLFKVSNVQEKLTLEFEIITNHLVRPVFYLIIILCPINWALEALKWKILVAKIEKTTFLSAFKGVIAGLSLGFMTPHNLGDYVGRIWQMKNSNRFQAIGSILLSHTAQFLVTCLMGLIGWLIFYNNKILLSNTPNNLILALSLILLLITITVLFIPNFLIYLVKKTRFLSRFENYITITQNYTVKERLLMLIISILRYLVFTAQFMLLLFILGANLSNLLIFAGITLVFFTKSVVPSFNFLSDLGLREVSALYFLGMLPILEPKIIAASLCLWIINILFPTIVGTSFIFTLKILK